MEKPSQDRVDNLRKVYAKRGVGRFKECIAAARRMETYMDGKVERVQLRASRGKGNEWGNETICEPGGHNGDVEVVTHGITFDQLWEFASGTIAYMSRSNGRYARNATKGQLSAKGTKDKYGAMERTAEQAVRKCTQLTHTKRQLGKMCGKLLKCERPPEREQLLSDIGALCEREGIRGLPSFLAHPHTLETKAEADAYIATLYAMFPMCGRGFKKYFLTPRIKQTRKLWDIAKPSTPETAETIALRYAAIMA